jgi:hypothetical protein
VLGAAIRICAAEDPVEIVEGAGNGDSVGVHGVGGAVEGVESGGADLFAGWATVRRYLQALSPAGTCPKAASVVITVAFEHGAGEKCQRKDRIKMV